MKRPQEATDSDSEADSEDSDIVRPSNPRAVKSRKTTASPRKDRKPGKEDLSQSQLTSPVLQSAPATSSSLSGGLIASPDIISPPYHYVNNYTYAPFVNQTTATGYYKQEDAPMTNYSAGDDEVNTSFSSTYSSLYHTSTMQPFLSEASHSTISAPANIQDAFSGLGFRQDQAPMCMSVHSVPQPYLKTVPNSPVLPSNTCISAGPHDLQAVSINAALPPWFTRPQVSYGQSRSFDSALGRTFSMPGSTDAHVASHIDSIRTLANTPVDMSPVNVTQSYFAQPI